MDQELLRFLEAEYSQKVAEIARDLVGEMDIRLDNAKRKQEEKASLKLAIQLQAEEDAKAGIGDPRPSSPPDGKAKGMTDEEFARYLQEEEYKNAGMIETSSTNASETGASGLSTCSSAGLDFTPADSAEDKNKKGQADTTIIQGKGNLRFAVPSTHLSKQDYDSPGGDQGRTLRCTNPDPGVDQPNDESTVKSDSDRNKHNVQPSKGRPRLKLILKAPKPLEPIPEGGLDSPLSQARILPDCLLPANEIIEINDMLDSIRGKSPSVARVMVSAMVKRRADLKHELKFIPNRFNNWRAEIITRKAPTCPPGISYASDEEDYSALPSRCLDDGCDERCPKPMTEGDKRRYIGTIGRLQGRADSVVQLDSSSSGSDGDDDSDGDSDEEVIAWQLTPDSNVLRSPHLPPNSKWHNLTDKPSCTPLESTTMPALVPRSPRPCRDPEKSLYRPKAGVKIKLRNFKSPQRVSESLAGVKFSHANLTFTDLITGLEDFEVDEPLTLETNRKHTQKNGKRKKRSDGSFEDDNEVAHMSAGLDLTSSPDSASKLQSQSKADKKRSRRLSVNESDFNAARALLDMSQQLPSAPFPFDLSSKMAAKVETESKRKASHEKQAIPKIVLPEGDELTDEGSRTKDSDEFEQTSGSEGERRRAKDIEAQTIEWQVEAWWKTGDGTVEKKTVVLSEAAANEEREHSLDAPVPQEFEHTYKRTAPPDSFQASTDDMKPEYSDSFSPPPTYTQRDSREDQDSQQRLCWNCPTLVATRWPPALRILRPPASQLPADWHLSPHDEEEDDDIEL